ncbi:hypothetical protein BAUCODRAFT_30189 [Baudoinia panamericana UAMH 10762]|uniref:Uncharacterized protein n=1 Tax=Baudoinia panamericana (strain UAMH 10762) TaxID=717646 RepID=M2LYJ4_BAUPA|nr:uncharacterized protein BAUCODRAFT_30189 [Baudoinia panamericana UAMH 10762]EMC99782.1 hypothetical protein BAUCODRAFT_30189 [Baudoinia panamericana UAMH 10762]
MAVEKSGRLDLQPLIDAQNDTKLAIEKSGRLDLQPLIDAQNDTKAAIEKTGRLDMQPLIDAQHATRVAVEGNGKLDLQPLIDSQRDLKAALVDRSNVDLQPLVDAQKETRAAIEGGRIDLQPLLEAQHATRAAVESNGKLDLQPLIDAHRDMRAAIEKSSKIDLTPLLNKMEQFTEVSEHVKSTSTTSKDTNTLLKQLLAGQEKLRDAVLDDGKQPEFLPITDKLNGVNEHLESLREWAEYDSEALKELVDAQKGTRAAVEAGSNVALDPLAGKFDALEGHLRALVQCSKDHEASLQHLIETHKSAPGPSVDLDPLAEHLEAIRTATENSGEQIRSLVEVQQTTPQTSTDIDFTPLTDRLNRIHATLEQQAERQNQPPSFGDPKFLMSALTSHLSKIQAVTESNALHVKSMREKQSATAERMQVSVASTSDAIAQLAQHHQRVQQTTDARLEAVTAQVREMMSGQREMVEVMRDLAKSITAQNKGSCDHVVIPPPRKVGRRVVGFVYDAKDDGEKWKGL